MPDQNIVLIIVGVVALVIGIIAGKLIFTPKTRRIVEAAQDQAQKIIADAHGRIKIFGATGMGKAPWLKRKGMSALSTSIHFFPPPTAIDG